LKAIALFSGGLDSTLAMKVIINQGIDVIALYVNIGFGSTKDRREHMESMCRQVGAEFMEIDIRQQFLRDILFSPKHGYGKNFNPCIDCHANMFRIAKEMMSELGASFIVSGEVAGQRPMSQNIRALKTVEELAESDNLLVRPLSAKLLSPSQPELNGWIDREKLLDISGRSREKQLKLADEFGLVDFEPPAGGCLLTEPYFAKKMRDFVKFDKLEVDDIDSLKFGRHFRLKDGAKLIIGRNADDNFGLQNVKSKKFNTLEAVGVKSPFSLISATASEDELQFALRTVLAYTKADIESEYKILFNGGEKEFIVKPCSSREESRKYSL
jgi:tRNA-specific 2-thiouridylase